MSVGKMTIGELLKEQLDRRSYDTKEKLTLEELFCKEKAEQWLVEILGAEKIESLKERIHKESDVRLSHTISTYLLGIAMRDHLDIRFDLLPRLISGGTGDAFHFFWAVICLCHDLGYEFEHNRDQEALNLMKTSDGRKKLLDIQQDLLEVDEKTLYTMAIDPNSSMGKWILESIDLAKRYDSMRRLEQDPDSENSTLDHGICGGLILYDVLYQKYVEIKKSRNMARENAVRHENKDLGMLKGIEKDASVVRFARCCLLVACTVARHNMWVANDKTKERYQLYKLKELLPPNVQKVSAASSAEQLLFLLDFMDTIDPVKAFYTRYTENEECSEEDLEKRKSFLLDKLRIQFIGPSCQDYAWGSTLIYRKIIFSVEKKDSLFDGFVKSISDLNDWLDVKAPQKGENYIQLYLPSYPGKRNHWIAGINDHEVNSLLLYMGVRVPGKYDRFHTCTDAYKTLNLLMMPGLRGEQVRVCVEQQCPNSIYIERWKMTLEVIIDIFSAQCKYADYQRRIGQPLLDCLYRGDRGVNYQLMEENEGTFALTSTAFGGYQEKFVINKQDPHILRITLGENVPYFDYEGFFGDQYVFSDEREVLLPPYIHMESKEKHFNDGLTHCEIYLDKFIWQTISEDEDELIQGLEEGCQKAAEEFKVFVDKKDMTCIPEDGAYYCWKVKFQKLCRLCMQSIYRAYCSSEQE